MRGGGRRRNVTFGEEPELTEKEQKEIDKKEQKEIKQIQKDYNKSAVLDKDGETVKTKVRVPLDVAREFVEDEKEHKKIIHFNPLDVETTTVKISIPKARERTNKDLIQQKKNNDIAELHLRKNKDLVGAGIGFKIMNL